MPGQPLAVKTAAPGVSTVTGTIEVEDPALYGEMMQPWDLTYSPVERGRFAHRLSFLKTPDFVFYKEYFSLAAVIQGASPPGVLAVTLPLNIGQRTLYWKKGMPRAGMPGTIPGPIDVTVDTDQLHLVLLVDLALLERALPEPSLSALLRAAGNRLVSAPEPDLARLTGWMCQTLDTARRYPATFAQPAVAGTVRCDLLQHLSLIASRLAVPNPSPGPARKRQRGIREVLDYLQEADACRVTVADLCGISDLSERTLEYGFRDTFGLTPQGFVRRKRFHMVRAALLCADPYETTVAAIAGDHGIYQLGRFAAEYRELFGELPSQTLRGYVRKPAGNLALHRAGTE